MFMILVNNVKKKKKLTWNMFRRAHYLFNRSIKKLINNTAFKRRMFKSLNKFVDLFNCNKTLYFI